MNNRELMTIEIADVKVAGWNDGGSVDIPVE